MSRHSRSRAGHSAARLTPGQFSYEPGAATIGGIPFDVFHARIASPIPGPVAPPASSEYIGVANGALVVGSDQAVIEKNLPYVLGTANAANAIRVPGEPGVAGRAEVDGGRVMQGLADALGFNRNDPDVNAQLSSLSGAFANGGPATVDLTMGQARMGATERIPYPFVEACIHFGQYCVAQKVNWMQLFLGQPPPPHHPRRRAPAPMPNATTL